MSIVISPSALWSMWTCPYKYANAIMDINPRDTAHWNLANCSAACALMKTSNKLWPWIRYYDKVINPWLEKKKQLDIEKLKKGMFNIYTFFKDLADWDNQIWQETKLEFPYNDEVWISWQPDVMVLYNKPENDIVAECIDIKCGKNSWYAMDDIRTENSQRVVYPWFMFQHFDQEIKEMWIKNPKIKFSFAVMDKWTWDFNLHSRTVDFRFVELQVKTRVEEFLKIKQSDIAKENYPAKKCRACAFCDFNWTCPLAKQSLDLEEKTIDDLF